jgi:hypothetical protein
MEEVLDEEIPEKNRGITLRPTAEDFAAAQFAAAMGGMR